METVERTLGVARKVLHDDLRNHVGDAIGAQPPAKERKANHQVLVSRPRLDQRMCGAGEIQRKPVTNPATLDAFRRESEACQRGFFEVKETVCVFPVLVIFFLAPPQKPSEFFKPLSITTACGLHLDGTAARKKQRIDEQGRVHGQVGLKRPDSGELCWVDAEVLREENDPP